MNDKLRVSDASKNHISVYISVNIHIEIQILEIHRPIFVILQARPSGLAIRHTHKANSSCNQKYINIHNKKKKEKR